MSVAAKICGITREEAMLAAVNGGARFVGLNFYPPSPRALEPSRAADLASLVPSTVRKVGVFVDPKDRLLETVLRTVALDILQLHGSEPPQRVVEIGSRFKIETMKAIKVAEAADLAAARLFEDAAQWLLFDAKPPAGLANALPGGNAVSFDWSLLARRSWSRPWFLAGGIDVENVAQATAQTGARYVDISSKVERRPGCKDPDMITAFLKAVNAL